MIAPKGVMPYAKRENSKQISIGRSNKPEIAINEGTLCAAKVACTVWSGGKDGDDMKSR